MANAGGHGNHTTLASWPVTSIAYRGGASNGDSGTQQSISNVGSCGASGKNHDPRTSQNNQLATPGQGNAAGNAYPLSNSGAPGGGGAGSPGHNTTGTTTLGHAGNGGGGAFSDAFSQFGESGFFAGGGGGGARQDSVGNGGYGGNGGGGGGGYDETNGIAGGANTGGGAGGGGQAGQGAAGGSGVVLIRYKRT